VIVTGKIITPSCVLFSDHGIVAADQLLAEPRTGLAQLLGARAARRRYHAELLQKVAARPVTAAPRLTLNGNARGYCFASPPTFWHDHLRRELSAGRAAITLHAEEPAPAAPPMPGCSRRVARRSATCGERAAPAQREVVDLRHHTGLTFQQIADRLGRPLGTVLTQIARRSRADRCGFGGYR